MERDSILVSGLPKKKVCISNYHMYYEGGACRIPQNILLEEWSPSMVGGGSGGGGYTYNQGKIQISDHHHLQKMGCGDGHHMDKLVVVSLPFDNDKSLKFVTNFILC